MITASYVTEPMSIYFEGLHISHALLTGQTHPKINEKATCTASGEPDWFRHRGPGPPKYESRVVMIHTSLALTIIDNH